MGRINQLPASATLNSTDVIAVDAGTGGTTNKMTATNLAGQLKALGNYQDKLTFDTMPTAGSTNPVTSGGIKTALDSKQSTLTFDTTPTAGSTNPVTSGGIATAISQSTAVKRITVTGTPNQYGSLAYTAELEAVADRITGIVSVTNGGRINVTTFWQSPKHYFACYDIYSRAAYTSELSITVSYI